jgi:hypothetical protein
LMTAACPCRCKHALPSCFDHTWQS